MTMTSDPQSTSGPAQSRFKRADFPLRVQLMWNELDSIWTTEIPEPTTLLVPTRADLRMHVTSADGEVLVAGQRVEHPHFWHIDYAEEDQ